MKIWWQVILKIGEQKKLVTKKQPSLLQPTVDQCKTRVDDLISDYSKGPVPNSEPFKAFVAWAGNEIVGYSIAIGKKPSLKKGNFTGILEK